MSQKELAKWLKVIVIIIAILSCLVFTVFVSSSIEIVVNDDPVFIPIIIPFKIYVWISAIPFYYALVLVWKICTDIGNDDSYSLGNIFRLKVISYLSVAECIYYAFFPIFMLVVFNAAQPGFMIIIFTIMIVCLAFGFLSALLSRLAQKAHDYKTDSEVVI